MLLPPFVVFTCFVTVVKYAIELDDESNFMAVKIRDVVTDRQLPSKLESPEASVT